MYGDYSAVSTPIRRVGMISVHTSPLDQPGTGDAGGMNVYIAELAGALAHRGVEVEIFTRATSSSQKKTVQAGPGVTVHYISAGPYEGLDKEELPGQLCAMASGVFRHMASEEPGYFDVLHSHYWLSGQVGWLASERWDVPLVHTMHTMAKVKNAALGPGESPEPAVRVIGEEQVVAEAARLTVNTRYEAAEARGLYGATAGQIALVQPGINPELFHPDRGADGRAAARSRARDALGLDQDQQILLFAGRVQPHKGPDVLVQALGELRAAGQPVPKLVIVGGPSGNTSAMAELRAYIHLAGLTDLVQVHPPVGRTELGTWYRAADAVVMPSRSESFGLVAAEAQASGVPVIAARVGGLQEIVDDDATGRLIWGHDPKVWAQELGEVLADKQRLINWADQAAARPPRTWDDVAEQMLQVYRSAIAE